MVPVDATGCVLVLSYKRITPGEDAAAAFDPVQDETGNHLPVRGVILRAHAPVEVRSDGLSDPGLKLLPRSLQMFIHAFLLGGRPH